MLGMMLLCGVALTGQGSVTCEPMPYHGWQDAIRLRNSVAEVVIVPSIGRIMRFAEGPISTLGGASCSFPRYSAEPAPFMPSIRSMSSTGKRSQLIPPRSP